MTQMTQQTKNKVALGLSIGVWLFFFAAMILAQPQTPTQTPTQTLSSQPPAAQIPLTAAERAQLMIYEQKMKPLVEQYNDLAQQRAAFIRVILQEHPGWTYNEQQDTFVPPPTKK